MVRTFERVGLNKNLRKSKSIVCASGLIWGQKGVEAYKRRDTVERPKFCESNITRVSCKECGVKMAESTPLAPYG